MLCVISRRPGFIFSIFAGIVYILLSKQLCHIGAPGEMGRSKEPYLGVFAALEEGGHADQADVVIPHDRVLGLITGDLEDVLEYYNKIVSAES